MPDRALFLGRFQPFHLGHLDVVQRLAREHDEVVVAIGSAQVSHTEKNPYTAGERLEMVHASCREAGLANVLPLPLPDVGRNSVWVSHVKSYVPPFSALYTNNPLMTRLFQEAGVKVLPAPFHARERYEGSRIRALMRTSGDWRALVPAATARVIDACDGARRVADIQAADVVVEGSDPHI
ncbi:MAG TPA: nicotinamide-nucleotide adenylyltransferase [Candidatus Thermoplasmatota archaeon]|nr:nicotinamide-nucleotide adenylyltransferase [Candidatus Thermoplasmatota archaeon]